MEAAYNQFLASPNSSVLAEDATLHYVTTATTFNGPAAIIKHFGTLQKQVKKKKQDVLNVIDGRTSLAFEVDTTLEFVTSGGVYLPGLDDNFLSDRVAQLPILHIVSLDNSGRISQIRQQWDQAALLKQMEVIGNSGRNWPIKNGIEQLRIIQNCLKSINPATAPSQDHNDVVIRTRGTSTNAMRDPHASLHLGGSREEIEAAASSSVVTPYAGHRPKQRSFADILGDEPVEGNETEHERSGSVVAPYAGHRPQQRSLADIINDEPLEDSHERSASPSKSGQGKNHPPMRLFDGQEYDENEETPKGNRAKQYIRPNPSKYKHFDLADDSEQQDRPQPGVSLEDRKKTKHDSQWSFDDFVTPHKSQPTKSALRHQDVRHWGVEDDYMGEAPEKPAGKGRRDAETHFEFLDDGERVARPDRPGHKAKGSAHNEGLGLYKNNLFDQDDAAGSSNRALGNITNLKDREKDFDAHFAMSDASPSQATPQRQQNVPENRKKVVRMMDSNWSLYDESPTQKENKLRNARPQNDQRIHIAGDGMGGKKGTNRNWLYGDAEDEEPAKPAVRQHAATQRHWELQ